MFISHRYCKFNKSGLNRTRCTIRGRPDLDGCIEDQPAPYKHDCDKWRHQGDGLTREQILEKIVYGKVKNPKKRVKKDRN